MFETMKPPTRLVYNIYNSDSDEYAHNALQHSTVRAKFQGEDPWPTVAFRYL